MPTPEARQIVEVSAAPLSPSLWHNRLLRAEPFALSVWSPPSRSSCAPGSRMKLSKIPALSAPMKVVWQGDDSDALHRLMVLPTTDLFDPSPSLGIDTVMLAHRLQRRHCSRLMFLEGLWRPTAAAFGTEASMSPESQELVERVYQKYLHEHSLMVVRVYRMACELVDATLAGRFANMATVRMTLHHHLAADINAVPLLPQERRHVDHFIHGAVLGHVLAEFDQDSLLNHPQRCWLLHEAALWLNYPLDREHLYLGAPMPQQQGAPDAE